MAQQIIIIWHITEFITIFTTLYNSIRITHNLHARSACRLKNEQNNNAYKLSR